MQFTFSSISLAEDINGNTYVSTLASQAGAPNDRGFRLPFFNPQIISQVKAAIARGEEPTFNLDAEISEETVKLGAVYFRRAQDATGKLLDTPALDPKTNKYALYRSIRVHTIFQYSMHDAYYLEGEKKGMRIMEQSYTPDGKPIMVPAKQFDLDDLGRPIKLYMHGWSKEERRDNILDTFFMLAPQEYQTQVAAEPEPSASAAPAAAAPQQSLSDVAQNLFQAPAGAPAAAPAATPQVDPLAQ